MAGQTSSSLPSLANCSSRRGRRIACAHRIRGPQRRVTHYRVGRRERQLHRDRAGYGAAVGRPDDTPRWRQRRWHGHGNCDGDGRCGRRRGAAPPRWRGVGQRGHDGAVHFRLEHGHDHQWRARDHGRGPRLLRQLAGVDCRARDRLQYPAGTRGTGRGLWLRGRCRLEPRGCLGQWQQRQRLRCNLGDPAAGSAMRSRSMASTTWSRSRMPTRSTSAVH